MKTILKGIGCFILALGIFFGLMMSIAMGSALGRMFYDEYKNEIPNTEKTNINAVTRSVSNSSIEYTDITDFSPSSEYKKYVIYRDFDTDNYKISWIQDANPGLLNNYDAIADLTNNGYNLDYDYNFAGEEPDIMEWFARSVNPSKQREGYISYFGEKITGSFSETISKQGNYLTSVISYGSLNDLFISMIKGTINYSPSNTINTRFFASDKITVGIIGAFQQEIYSNYNELNLTQIYVTSDSVHNYFLSDIPQDVSSRVVNLANELQENYNKGEENGFQSGYDTGYDKGKEDGYRTGLDQYKYGIFADAVLDSVVMEADGYKIPNAKLDFITGGISTNTIANLVSVRVDSNPEIYENNQRFTIALTLNPFTWQQGLLYTQSVYAYRSMVFISNTGTRYAMNISEDKGASNDIFGSTYYMIKEASSIPSTTVITKIEIECANFDYTPVFLQPTGGYNAGYNSGFNVGKVQGYNEGYDKAMSVSNNLFSYILSVAQVPVNMIQDMLDFEILGVNMANFVLSIFTACLVIVVLKIFI